MRGRRVGIRLHGMPTDIMYLITLNPPTENRQFWGCLYLSFKASPMAKPSFENNLYVNETSFHMKGFTLRDSF